MVHMCVKVTSIVCFSTVDGFEVVRSFTHWQELLCRSPYTVMTSLGVCVASHQCVCVMTWGMLLHPRELCQRLNMGDYASTLQSMTSPTKELLVAYEVRAMLPPPR